VIPAVPILLALTTHPAERNHPARGYVTPLTVPLLVKGRHAAAIEAHRRVPEHGVPLTVLSPDPNGWSRVG
jgi:hypothetical protein